MYYKTAFILILFFIVSSCDNSVSKSDELYDEELMQDIIDAVQIDINLDDLPSLSRSDIDQNYNDYTEIDAKMADGLGYQVSMDGKGYKPGGHNEVYYNLKGRKLKTKRDSENKNGFKCFEMVLPVTFIMPNGLAIIVEDENGYISIRDWYENNIDIREKPTLQYPIKIIYKDAHTQIINNDEEIKITKAECRKWDDSKKNWNCFKFVYPITFIMLDGSVISMEDGEDWTEIKAWYESNSNVEERPTLQYPLDIIYQDGSTGTINNYEGMENAKDECLN